MIPTSRQRAGDSPPFPTGLTYSDLSLRGDATYPVHPIQPLLNTGSSWVRLNRRSSLQLRPWWIDRDDLIRPRYRNAGNADYAPDGLCRHGRKRSDPSSSASPSNRKWRLCLGCLQQRTGDISYPCVHNTCMHNNILRYHGFFTVGGTEACAFEARRGRPSTTRNHARRPLRDVSGPGTRDMRSGDR